MSIFIEWYDTRRDIAQLLIHGEWQLDETARACKQIRQMIVEQPHDVDLIMDLRNAHGLPFGLGTLVQREIAMAPPNIRQLVIITENTLYRQFGAQLVNLAGWKNRYMFVADLEDALTRLRGAMDGHG